MKTIAITPKEKKAGKSALHYVGLGLVYAMGLFVVILQLRSII